MFGEVVSGDEGQDMGLEALLKFRKTGADVEVIGLNDASATIMDKLAVHDQPDAMEKVLGH